MTKRNSVILWLTGWGMADSVFDRLRDQLPDYWHSSANIQSAHSPEAMISIARTAVLACSNLHAKSVIVAGWSLGGLLALRLADEHIVHGLVLFGSTACFAWPMEDKMPHWSNYVLRHMKMALQCDQEEALHQFYRSIFTIEELSRGLAAHIPSDNEWTMPALLAGLQLLQTEDFRATLPELTCPVLLFHGTMDRICPIGAAEEIEQRIRHAKLIRFAGSGHLPFLGNELKTVEAIRRWWREHATGCTPPPI